MFKQPQRSVTALFFTSRWPKAIVAIILAAAFVHLYYSIADIHNLPKPWHSSSSGDDKVDIASYLNSVPHEIAVDRINAQTPFNTSSKPSNGTLMDLDSFVHSTGAATTGTQKKVKPTSVYHTHPVLQSYAIPPEPTATDQRTVPTAPPSRISLDTVDYQTGLDTEAHRITDPDLFRDHFQAVLNLENITLSQARSTCNWPKNVKPIFMYHDSIDWAVHDVSDDLIAQARARWQGFMRSDKLKPWRPNQDRFRGRGIVIVGGHTNTIRRIKLQLKVLKAFNSRLPVEIHHWKDEIDEMQKWELQQLHHDLRTVDLSRDDNLMKTLPPAMNGYHLKVNAVINSGFSEVLLLDADNIPMYDPEIVFESQTYQEYGTVFWPDVMRTRVNNPVWSATNTYCKMDEYEMESGQMLVDKRRFFYHLQLSSFFMQDFFIAQYLLGDKDMFRMAWHALKTPYGKPGRWISTLGTRYVDDTHDFFCGRCFGQHHPDSSNGSIAFLHLNAVKRMDENTLKYYRENGGLFEWFKTPRDPYNWSAVQDAGHKGEETPFLKVAPKFPSLCVDIWGAEEVPSQDIVPGFNDFFEHVGGYDILLETVGR